MDHILWEYVNDVLNIYAQKCWSIYQHLITSPNNGISFWISSWSCSGLVLTGFMSTKDVAIERVLQFGVIFFSKKLRVNAFIPPDTDIRVVWPACPIFANILALFSFFLQVQNWLIDFASQYIMAYLCVCGIEINIQDEGNRHVYKLADRKRLWIDYDR